MDKRLVRWGVVLALLAAGAAGLILMAARGRGADDDWRKAQAAIDERDFLDAQRHLVQYITRWRQDTLAHLVLARCYRRAPSVDFELAQDQLRIAKELGGHEEDREFERDLLDYQRLGRPLTFQQRVEAYLESRPEDAALVYEALARGAMQDGRREEALQWLDRWIEQYPEDWWGRLWRGVLLHYLDRTEAAVEDLRWVYERRSDDPEVAKRLGVVLAVSGSDYEEAETLLTGYLDEHPEDADALTALAVCHHATGRTERAMELIEQALEVNRYHASALTWKARWELEQDRPAEARQTVRRLEHVVRESRASDIRFRMLALEPRLAAPRLTEWVEDLLRLQADVLDRLDRTEEARQRRQELEQVQAVAGQLENLLEAQRSEREKMDLVHEILQAYMKLDLPMEAEDWLRQMEMIDAGDPRIAEATSAIEARQRALSAAASR